MRNILFSVFGQKDKMYQDYLQTLLDEADNYSKNFKVQDVLTKIETDYLEFIVNSFQAAGEAPSQTLFEQNFPETVGSFISCKMIRVQDFRVYIYNFLDGRVNSYINRCITQLNKEVKIRGMTEDIVKEFNRLQSLSNRNKAKDIQLRISAKIEYDLMKSRPQGLKTGIKEVDDRIGGMNAGTVTTIAGFTSQFKTTWALNIAYYNAYDWGYNIAYISLETPKQDMYWNLLSRHSYSDQFNKFQYISHDKMRRCALSVDEEDYLYNEVEKDLYEPVLANSGKLEPRGQVIFLDESDFNTLSFGEITAALEKVDDELGKTGLSLDAVIVDYVQLCKFSGSGMTSDANSQINSYVTFFRRLGQNFRKVVDAQGNEVTKRLTVILLAQLNRTGWVKAARSNGRYDLTALADANELERGSARIFTTFTTEEMKARNSAQVQILKNRAGQTMYDPALVFVEPGAYVFCDENAGQGGFVGGGGNLTSSLTDMFAGSDNMDFGTFGLT